MTTQVFKVVLAVGFIFKNKVVVMRFEKKLLYFGGNSQHQEYLIAQCE